MSLASGSETSGAHASAQSSHAEPLVRVENIWKEFPARSEGLLSGTKLTVKAVAGVSLEIYRGETLGLVGESGSGKSTLGRLILRLMDATRGSVWFDGRDLSTLSRSDLRALRREMQLVFQDPYASLNPRMKVRAIIGEGIEIHNLARGRRVEVGRGARWRRRSWWSRRPFARSFVTTRCTRSIR